MSLVMLCLMLDGLEHRIQNREIGHIKAAVTGRLKLLMVYISFKEREEKWIVIDMQRGPVMLST